PTKLFRITNNKYLRNGKSQKLQKISELIGPPPAVSRYNRCNLPGESVFYAALDLKTAIWETQPGEHDYVTVSEWKIKEGQRLNAHAIFHPEMVNINRDSQHALESYLQARKGMSKDKAQAFHEIFKFLTEEFMK